MKFLHFSTVFGYIAVPAQFAAAVWQVLEFDFDGAYVPTRDVQMVAQIPGAFWIK